MTEPNRFRFRVYDELSGTMYPVSNLQIATDKFGDRIIVTGNHTKNKRILEGKYILMQSTGLADRKDQEMFEGDVIYYRDIASYAKIIWYQSGFALDTCTSGEDYISEIDWSSTDKFDVLGNVYQNPELMKTI